MPPTGRSPRFAQHSTPDPELLRYEAFGPRRPAFEGRGLGSAIVDWTEAQTRSRDRARASTARLWNSVQAGQRGRDRAARVVRLHRHPHRSGRWRCDLDASFEAGAVPEGVTIRPFVMDVDGPAAQCGVEHGVPIALRPRGGDVRGVAGAAGSRRHVGPSPRSCSPRSTARIVGVSNNGVIDGIGYVFELGVLPEMQGRGIGRALLRHSFAMLAARGITNGRLGVDTQNATGSRRALSVGRADPRRASIAWSRSSSRPTRLLTPAERGPT